MGTSTMVAHAAAPPPDELLLAADSSKLAVARRFVERAAVEAGMDPERVACFVYAVNEAVTNAIRHGESDGRGLIRLSTVIEDERLTVEVRDNGNFVMPRRPPREGSEGGRGFALMTRFADEVRLVAHPGETTVSLSMECLR